VVIVAGRGRISKDPARRVRRHADPLPLRVITAAPVKQPALPKTMPLGRKWPAQTRAWWRMWRESPLSETFTATDWSELLDTALLHAVLWSGNTKVAGEVRLRVAKFGAETPALSICWIPRAR
jgi:hypothetical protein